MSHDPELPNGFQDADFDMRDLESAGRRVSALRRKGICSHGWRKYGNGFNGVAKGHFACLEPNCGAVIEGRAPWEY